MKGKLKYLLLLPLLITGCNFNKPESNSFESDSSLIESSEQESESLDESSSTKESESEQESESTTSEESSETSNKAAWTILLYICGSDLESGEETDYYGDPTGNINALATLDITEILSVKNKPSDVNIVIQTGGASKWDSKYGISNKKLGRYVVNNNKLQQVTQLSNASMGSQNTFESFLNWGLSTYPAEKTGIILWNHGGALDGCCYDENYSDDSLTNKECNNAFKNVFSKQNISDKLEFVGYDCCLMQVQDIAEVNSHYFNYMVAAQESEAGEGWAYDTWLDDLYAKKDTKTILKAICDGFIKSYEETYGDYYDNDQTLSVLDLSKIGAYKEAFESFANSVKSSFTSNSSKVVNIIKKSKMFASEYCTKDDYNLYVHSYGYDASWFQQVTIDGAKYYLLYGAHVYGTVDAKDFLTRLEADSTFSSYSSQITNVISLLDEVVIYNAIGDEAENANGLTLIAPLNEYVGYTTGVYTNFTNWKTAIGNIL